MEELSKRELLALKEIHLTGETSDKELIRKFVDSVVHHTRADAEADNEHFDGKTTE
jgi:hypothetical protein